MVDQPLRLVIVVRADPVICGHSGEARNLAEAALQRGFTEVRIVTWPVDRLAEVGLPLKPLDHILPYSEGITVERPGPVGDNRVPDGRFVAGLTGRLVELFTDGVPTVCMSLYLSPHTLAVVDAVAVARDTGLPVDVVTIAEAVGSDITNVVRACVAQGRFGSAFQVLSAYLANDVCVAVSQYTVDLILEEAAVLDEQHGTRYAERLAQKVAISYPAIDTSAYLGLADADVDAHLAARGLVRDGYVFFLSRLAAAKGVDDLVDGFAASRLDGYRLVVAGRGPQAEAFRAHAAASPVADRVLFLDDVGDDEKPYLMAGAAAYVLPSTPRPEFVETFGIALVEKALAGGGPVITTNTGGIHEAIGDHALYVPAGDSAAIAEALDRAVLGMGADERAAYEASARAHGLQFDRLEVFDRLFARLPDVWRARLGLGA